ncbi:hypothetical protein RF11_13549 [Thelohanellus kitauei]|uniref:Tetraspanin n=1 Tax=Thelohanellus kitauei TaxID=669202 RepID=A0A0C2MNW6_THEKT|nr:hypothetical protein RF11_13549 [Thelohanellus kitauei]
MAMGVLALNLIFLETIFSDIFKYREITVLCVLGFVLAILQIIGLFGICRRVKFFEVVYTSLCCLFLICSTILLLIVFINQRDIRSIVPEYSKLCFDLTGYKDNWFINRLQKNNQCCGLTGKENWKTQKYPPSCCVNQISPCERPFQKSCWTFLIHWISLILVTLVGTIECIIFLSVRIQINKPIVIIGMIVDEPRTVATLRPSRTTIYI